MSFLNSVKSTCPFPSASTFWIIFSQFDKLVPSFIPRFIRTACNSVGEINPSSLVSNTLKASFKSSSSQWCNP
ncbi:hypothetical protein Mapa_016639 [Marchantia paleacea]|nr:hypothetical protein Mapa_016639 [Marchantia paleacea]